MATHSSNLTWRIPWTEEPDGLQTMGLQKVGCLSLNTSCLTFRKNLQDVSKAKKPLHIWKRHSKHQKERDMAGILELPDREFKTNLINRLRALMDNIDSMQKQMGSANSHEAFTRTDHIWNHRMHLNRFK